MIKITKVVKGQFILKAAFDSKTINAGIVKKVNVVTDFPSKNESYIYLGKKEKFTNKEMKATAKAISKLNTRDFQISAKTFVSKSVSQTEVVNNFVIEEEFENAKIYNAKTGKKTKAKTLKLVDVDAKGKAQYKISKIHAESMTYARNFQMAAPNVLTSESFAKELKTDFTKISNVSVKVLNKKQITDLKMGLFLSVNIGSAYEPRVVVL